MTSFISQNSEDMRASLAYDDKPSACDEKKKA